MKYFVDTNVFLRFLVKEDIRSFEDCVSFFEMIKTGKIGAVTSSLVLAEIGWTLKSYYQQDKEKVVSCLKSIVALPGLVIEDRVDWLHALESYSKFSIKMIDCLLASGKEIREKKWTVVTYDKDFNKLDVLSLDPGRLK